MHIYAKVRNARRSVRTFAYVQFVESAPATLQATEYFCTCGILEYTWGPYTENSNFFVNTKILQKAVKKKEERNSWTNRDYEKCTLEPLLAGYSPNISWSRSSELKITFYFLTVAQQAI